MRTDESTSDFRLLTSGNRSDGLISFTLGRWVSLAVLIGLFIWLYLRLPHPGDISNPDAPVHAMDGAFILDLVTRMPIHHPVMFAYDYFRQYPALSILFYPPLFHASLALGYALFGVSGASAMFVEMVWFFFLAWGCFSLSRNWLDSTGSLAVSILVVGEPLVFYWGQQIMLDVAAYCLMIWAMHFAMAYFRSGRTFPIALSALLTALTVWTKYNDISYVLVMGIAFLTARGTGILRERAVLGAAALGALMLLPAVLLFLNFGMFDMHLAYTPLHGLPAPLSAPLYYIRALPALASWPALVLAVAYACLAVARRSYRLDRASAALLLSVIGVTYVFYTTVSVKDARYIMIMGYPIALAAILGIDRTLASPWREGSSLAVACAVLASSLWTVPAPYITGMRKAAEVAAHAAPPNSNIAVWCRYNGAVVFSLRAYKARHDLGIVRLDKLLFSGMTEDFEYGFKQNPLDADQIYQKLMALHTQYVLFQDRYNNDLYNIRQLKTLLLSDKFVQVASFPMISDYKLSPLTTIHVYRMQKKVPSATVRPHLEIDLLGWKKI